MMPKFTGRVDQLGPPGNDNVVWDDIRIVPGSFQFLGGADPTPVAWQPGASGSSFLVYAFQLDDEVFATCQMPHGYKEGSPVHFHIHWTPKDRGNEESGNYVGWKIDYSIANSDVAFPSSATLDLSSQVTGTDDYHEFDEAPAETVMTGKLISHIIMMRIYRSDTGTDDTWVGTTAAQSPALLEVDVHYQSDSLGSNSELAKTW
jgi:hypothetical protein